MIGLQTKGQPVSFLTIAGPPRAHAAWRRSRAWRRQSRLARSGAVAGAMAGACAGRVALVTGASRGIGRAIALRREEAVAVHAGRDGNCASAAAKR